MTDVRSTPSGDVAFSSFSAAKNAIYKQYLRHEAETLLKENPKLSRDEIAERLDVSPATLSDAYLKPEWETDNNEAPWWDAFARIGLGAGFMAILPIPSRQPNLRAYSGTTRISCLFSVLHTGFSGG